MPRWIQQGAIGKHQPEAGQHQGQLVKITRGRCALPLRSRFGTRPSAPATATKPIADQSALRSPHAWADRGGPDCERRCIPCQVPAAWEARCLASANPIGVKVTDLSALPFLKTLGETWPLKNGAGGTRTHDLRFRKPSLYPAELQPHRRHYPRWLSGHDGLRKQARWSQSRWPGLRARARLG